MENHHPPPPREEPENKVKEQSPRGTSSPSGVFVFHEIVEPARNTDTVDPKI